MGRLRTAFTVLVTVAFGIGWTMPAMRLSAPESGHHHEGSPPGHHHQGRVPPDCAVGHLCCFTGSLAVAPPALAVQHLPERGFLDPAPAESPAIASPDHLLPFAHAPPRSPRSSI